MRFPMSIALVCSLLPLSHSRADVVNGNFTQGFTGWTKQGGGGGTTVRGAINSNPDIAPPDMDGNQAQITNSGGGNPTTTALQGFLGLSGTDLADLAPNGDPTQGAIIFQNFDASQFGSQGAQLTFSWNFLTDEAVGSLNQDFAFVSVTGNGLTFLQMLSFVDDPNLQPGDNDTTNVLGLNFGGLNGRQIALPTPGYQTATFTISPTGIPTGSYILGFGVLDANSTTNNSILYIDAVSLTQLPEPSSIAFLVLGIGVSIRRLRRRGRFTS